MNSHQVTVGAVGFRIEVAIVDDDYAAIDLSDVTSAYINVYRPDATILNLTATIDTTNDVIYYDTTTGQLNNAGTYICHPLLIFTDGDSLESQPFSIVVSSRYSLE
jgi:hypothetical protein